MCGHFSLTQSVRNLCQKQTASNSPLRFITIDADLDELELELNPRVRDRFRRFNIFCVLLILLAIFIVIGLTAWAIAHYEHSPNDDSMEPLDPIKTVSQTMANLISNYTD
ncbi:hypothetical protein [Carp edema virus]|nr:hypothetical protein [Carp edema virus]